MLCSRTVQHGGPWPHVAVQMRLRKNSVPPQHCTFSPALATFHKPISRVWLMDTQCRLQGTDSLKQVLLHSPALSFSTGFDVFSSYANSRAQYLTFGVPRWLFHCPHPEEAAPTSSFLSLVPVCLFLLFCFSISLPTLVALPPVCRLSFLQHQLPPSRMELNLLIVSMSQEGAGRRASAVCGICPPSVESSNTPNFHTVHIDNPLTYCG